MQHFLASVLRTTGIICSLVASKRKIYDGTCARTTAAAVAVVPAVGVCLCKYIIGTATHSGLFVCMLVGRFRLATLLVCAERLSFVLLQLRESTNKPTTNTNNMFLKNSILFQIFGMFYYNYFPIIGKNRYTFQSTAVSPHHYRYVRCTLYRIHRTQHRTLLLL